LLDRAGRSLRPANTLLEARAIQPLSWSFGATVSVGISATVARTRSARPISCLCNNTCCPSIGSVTRAIPLVTDPRFSPQRRPA